MLGQRRRRWPNINPTLFQCVLLAGEVFGRGVQTVRLIQGSCWSRCGICPVQLSVQSRWPVMSCGRPTVTVTGRRDTPPLTARPGLVWPHYIDSGVLRAPLTAVSRVEVGEGGHPKPQTPDREGRRRRAGGGGDPGFKDTSDDASAASFSWSSPMRPHVWTNRKHRLNVGSIS